MQFFEKVKKKSFRKSELNVQNTQDVSNKTIMSKTLMKHGCGPTCGAIIFSVTLKCDQIKSNNSFEVPPICRIEFPEPVDGLGEA